MGFRERDYLQKQVEGLAKVLAAILGLKDAGRIDEARAELERSAKSVLGVGMDLLGRVDVGTAVRLLRSPVKAESYAQLLEVQASLEDNDSLRERAKTIRDQGQ